jgi:hypothetical protein
MNFIRDLVEIGPTDASCSDPIGAQFALVAHANGPLSPQKAGRCPEMRVMAQKIWRVSPRKGVRFEPATPPGVRVP